MADAWLALQRAVFGRCLLAEGFPPFSFNYVHVYRSRSGAYDVEPDILHIGVRPASEPLSSTNIEFKPGATAQDKAFVEAWCFARLSRPQKSADTALSFVG